MTSPEHRRSGPQHPHEQPGHDFLAPEGPTSASTPRRAPDPASPAPPLGAPGFSLDQDPQTYDAFYRHVYGENAPPDEQGGTAAQPWPQHRYPDPRYAPPGIRASPYHPGLPAGYAPYNQVSTPDRDFALALGLTAAGFLGVAGLQYFYIGKIGKGVAYLLTAGWFGIGTVVSLFTIGDEVIRTNDERRRGLR